MSQSCRIVKEFHFDAAHLLSGHKGRCSSLHGHRYRLELTYTAECLHRDMVIDFGDLSRIVGDWIEECFDHLVLLWGDNEPRLLEFLKDRGMRYRSYDMLPTAEVLARDIFYHVPTLKRDDGVEVVLEQVRIWETPTCSAIFSRKRTSSDKARIEKSISAEGAGVCVQA